ncbi:MAG: hypothetical protein RJB38_2227 [Pseudomonadota bacterium]|jgi:multimeric flavodoxin WrbA
MKTLAILGSARKESNTLQALKRLSPMMDYEIIDLLDYRITPYCYDPTATAEDDFLPLARRMTEADALVFATPVYWYAMSGVMKDFFDRLTDLITANKPIGRALKGRKCYLTACGTDPELPEGFEVPFRRTCDYFDMEFVQSFYWKSQD